MEINELIFAFFDSDGPGGVVILLVLFGACAIYYLLTRWIIAGGKTSARHVVPPSEVQPASDQTAKPVE